MFWKVQDLPEVCKIVLVDVGDAINREAALVVARAKAVEAIRDGCLGWKLKDESREDGWAWHYEGLRI